MQRPAQAHSEGRAVARLFQVLDTSRTGVARRESSAAPSEPPLHISHTGSDIEPGTGENAASFVSAPAATVRPLNPARGIRLRLCAGHGSLPSCQLGAAGFAWWPRSSQTRRPGWPRGTAPERMIADYIAACPLEPKGGFADLVVPPSRGRPGATGGPTPRRSRKCSRSFPSPWGQGIFPRRQRASPPHRRNRRPGADSRAAPVGPAAAACFRRRRAPTVALATLLRDQPLSTRKTSFALERGRLTGRPSAPAPGCSSRPRSARRTPPADRARTATPPTASA